MSNDERGLNSFWGVSSATGLTFTTHYYHIWGNRSVLTQGQYLDNDMKVVNYGSTCLFSYCHHTWHPFSTALRMYTMCCMYRTVISDNDMLLLHPFPMEPSIIMICATWPLQANYETLTPCVQLQDLWWWWSSDMYYLEDLLLWYFPKLQLFVPLCFSEPTVGCWLLMSSCRIIDNGKIPIFIV